MATLAERDEFLDLVLADEDLVRAEFEAIVNGLRDEPEPPARPVRPVPPAGRTGRLPPGGRLPVTHRPHLPERARQRSPPPGDRARSRADETATESATGGTTAAGPLAASTNEPASAPHARRGEEASRPAVPNEVASEPCEAGAASLYPLERP